MFIHNFKYTIKTLLKNKALIFWTFAFPIILGTFFNMAFSNIENSESFKSFDIAVIENKNYEDYKYYKNALDSISDENSDNKIFNINYLTREDALNALENDEIYGIITFQDKPEIIVKASGINETILETVTEEIREQIVLSKDLIENKIKNIINTENSVNIDYAKLSSELYKQIEELIKQNETNIEDITNKNMSYTMIEFYTLIAMTCLYGGILGMVAINKSLANMSNHGKRVSISAIKKSSLIISNVLASYLIQLFGLALLFIYTIFVLKIDYGDNIPLIILLSLIGSLAGLSLGITTASVFKTNENLKTGIMISFTMLGCFLSGMMGITMKYIIDKNLPIINMLNPANMITDGFYSLYYYGPSERYYFNIISLLIFTGILLSISIFSLRRQKYDYI